MRFLAKYGWLAALTVAVLALTPLAAGATNISFTGNPYNTWTPSGPHSYADSTAGEIGPISWTVSAWTGSEDNLVAGNLGFKTQTANSNTAAGIGVNGGYAGNEIDPGETLMVDFTGNPLQIFLESFTLNFLYNEYTPNPTIDEEMKYRLNGGAWVYVSQSDLGQTYPNPFTSGALTVNFAPFTPIYTLEIRSNGEFDNDSVLNAMNVSNRQQPDTGTPEPGTMLLFGSAAGAIGFLRRRFGKSK